MWPGEATNHRFVIPSVDLKSPSLFLGPRGICQPTNHFRTIAINFLTIGSSCLRLALLRGQMKPGLNYHSAEVCFLGRINIPLIEADPPMPEDRVY